MRPPTRVLLGLMLTTGLVQPSVAQRQSVSSSGWLGLLPAGEAKRKFILDCTGCHQFDSQVAEPDGKRRTRAEWVDAVRRMLGYAGATTSFPVIAADRDAEQTADMLTAALLRNPAVGSTGPVTAGRAEVREYLMPSATDLPHDIAVDSTGRVVVTGMFSHVMYVVDTASGAMQEIALPAERGGPRAVEVDGVGDWWVLLGGPQLMARYRPSTGRWDTWPIGMYPHSVALDHTGRAWFNGHFTSRPELVGSVNPATGKVETFPVPVHPTMGHIPGGPIPYELRLAPNGSVWGSELQGNRIFSLSPATREFETFDLPTPFSGPRRFDIDANGILWIPAYSANKLVQFDPQSRRFTEHELPLPDAVPYIARADSRREVIWLGTAAADQVLKYEPKSGRFTAYPLPSRGALVRHLTIDPRTGDLWLAYGASPSRIASRIARFRPQ